MKRTIWLVILFMFHSGQAFAGGDVNVRDYSDPSKPIEVAAGQQFIITVESNRTTGYQWQLAGVPDSAVVQLENVEYRVSNTGLVGAGGMEVWRFKALGPGKTAIAIKYVRPWEKDVPPVKHLQFTVIIHR
ncbi:MAG: protease inhibitor I42 family protein [Deltaproteobacteria bacterium]|nr:protease inhibitor I42 family protein [Deltaproteobacteria bacterium]